MPDLIQVADDLKHMPDGWLAQQAQQPSGMVPPYLVMAEMQRREKLRSGQSKAQAPESSVAQDMIRNLYAKIPPTAGLMPQQQPPGAVPPGMPPVNLTPSAGALGPTAPGNLRVPPTRTMADGGEVDDEDEGDLYNLPLTQEPSRDRLMQQLYIPPAQPAPPAQPVMSPRGSANRSAGRGLFNAPGKYDAYVRAAAEETKLDPDFIRSVMNVESNQNPNAVSGAGAVGLMQVLPSTAMSEFGVTPEQLRNPATNIRTGARYLRKLVDLYHGDQRTAAMAYNMGPGNIAKGRTNQGYADKVLDNFQKLHEQGGAPPVQETGGMPGWLASSRSWNIPQVPDTGDAASAVGMGSADTGTAETPAAGTPAAPVTAAPAAAPVKQAPLQQVWNPPPSTQVADLDKQIAAFQKGHQSVDERTKALFGDDNIDLLNQAAGKLIGARPDYSQYQSAINNVMQVAQKQMHPSIGGALMQFGLALMSSKSHYFGQAVGEAGSYAFAAMQKQQQQATRDFLDAAKAGVNLQEHISLYDEKLTQYKMARLGAMQTGITADEKSYQSDLAGLMKKRDQAAAAFDKANSTPAANNVRAIAILNENRSAFDPSQYKDPMQQVAALFPQAVDQAMGKNTATATKAPPVTDQLMQAAIHQVMADNGIAPPEGRAVRLEDLPQNLQKAAVDLNAKYGAQKTVATQQAVAESMSPEAIELMGTKLLNGEPVTSRNAIIVGKAYDAAARQAKALGLTNMQLMMEQHAAKANQGALVQLTKNTESVEAFSKLAEKNIGVLEGQTKNVADYGAPIWNTPLRDLQKRWLGDTKVTGFQTALIPVQTEIARVLSSANAQGGVLSDHAREEMQKAIDPGATAAQIKTAVDIFRQDMANRREVYAAQVADLKQRTVVGQTGGGGGGAGTAAPTGKRAMMGNRAIHVEKGKWVYDDTGKPVE